MGVFDDWKGANLLSNIMLVYMFVMMFIVMSITIFFPYASRETTGLLFISMFVGIMLFGGISSFFNFWMRLQKANTSVLWGWFDLEPGVVELTKIQIEEEVPVKELSPKEKEDLKKFMDEYFKKFKENVPIEDLSEEELEYMKQKEEDEAIV